MQILFLKILHKGDKDLNSLRGKLDNVTLLRYATIYKEESGGIESYLRDLDNQLLRRNQMTIIQMYMFCDTNSEEVVVEDVGRGRHIWIPCRLRKREKHLFTLNDLSALCVEAGIVKLPLRMLRYFRHGYYLLQKEVLKAIRNCSIDLISFHWLNLDSREIIDCAVTNHIPFVVVNHFENEIFNWSLVKKQMYYARAVGGVSGVNVPEYLRDRYIPLYDGIDTAFFDPVQATFPEVNVNNPIIFMPSRIVEDKGHIDLVEAARRLKSMGVTVTVVFAGRIDSEKHFRHLKESIAQLELQDDVIFLGLIDQETLRNWYFYSQLVVLPTQFMEGIPRVLLEAQAMKKAVITYDSGGVADGIEDGISGFILQKGDVRQLTEKIAELIRDDSKRTRMGECGRAFILNRFGLFNLAERYEEFYLNALVAPRVEVGQ